MRRRMVFIMAALWMAALLAGCGGAGEAPTIPAQTPVPAVTAEGSQPEPAKSPQPDGEEQEEPEETNEEEQEGMKLNVQIGNQTFTATLEDNRAVEELVEMIREEGSVNLWLEDYGGFEKVGPLGRRLTTSDSQTTTEAGDIVLYQGDNIVMFYGSNAWSYTRLGKIDDLTGWAAALGRDGIAVVLTLAE